MQQMFWCLKCLFVVMVGATAGLKQKKSNFLLFSETTLYISVSHTYMHTFLSSLQTFKPQF